MREWAIPVTHADGTPADLTGWSAEWLLGTPPAAQRLQLLPTAYTPTGIRVLKASGANLDIVTVGGASTLRFTTTYADTVGLMPSQYWQQAVAIDPMGNPKTVREGIVNLTPSLRALRTSVASPLALSPVVPVSFAVWQGDDTPPQVWSFGAPNNLANLTGSVFELIVTGLTSPSGTLTARSDAGDGVLVMDPNAQTVTWNYSQTVSAAIPTSGAAYQLHRLIGGTRQLWTHGSIVGLAP